MFHLTRIVLVFCYLTSLTGIISAAQVKEGLVPIGDPVTENSGWKYIGGEEFPGAQGAFSQDTVETYDGKATLKLSADFSAGGVYVGIWQDMPDVKECYIVAVRMWVKSDNLNALGVRISDKTGQCHQSKTVPLTTDTKWHELILPQTDLVGSEYWGGANDGKWHGPGQGFGVNIGKDNLLKDAPATLWLAKIQCVTTTAQRGIPTVLPCKLSQPTCRPGFGVDLTYYWDTQPMDRDFTVSVHFIGPDGGMAFQDDHDPLGGTSVWSGPVEYDHTIVIPMDASEGEYKIMVGLYDHAAADRNWDRQILKAAEGVLASDNDTTCQIGTLIIDNDAPVPELDEPTLDLKDYHLTFAEEFDASLDISAWGPGTRWISHTPYAGDFGDVRFADPGPNSPFTVADGMLQIEARKTENGWQAGLLSSVDPKGDGFSQQYGYFEMRAKFPKGKGTWPAFWLLGVAQLKDKFLTQIEIDVVEQYGVAPNALNTTVHLWYPDAKHWADGRASIVQGMTDDFHNYGVMVTPEDVIFYFDGIELRRMKTPEEAKVPLYILANLALGGGWPINETPNPSCMQIDYIRAYGQ